MPLPISLRSRVVNLIIFLAKYGWGPDDLLHVLGPASHPLLFEAAPFIPANIQTVTLRKAWLRLGPPTQTDVADKDLHRMLKLMPSLGQLDDAALLTATYSDPSNSNLTDKQQRARERVEKLLRKAESTQFSDEAESLVAKAQMLRQRYRIEEAKEPENLRVITRRVYIHSPWVRQQYHLLACIAHFNGTATLLLNKHGIATVVGSPSDVEHVIDLYRSLNRQCAFFLDRSPNAAAARANNETAAYRRSFWIAYADRISQLLDTATTAPHASDGDEDGTSDTTAVALAESLPALTARYDRAVDAMNELFPNLRVMHLSASHVTGFTDGASAADRSHLGGDSAGLAGQRAICG